MLDINARSSHIGEIRSLSMIYTIYAYESRQIAGQKDLHGLQIMLLLPGEEPDDPGDLV